MMPMFFGRFALYSRECLAERRAIMGEYRLFRDISLTIIEGEYLYRITFSTKGIL